MTVDGEPKFAVCFIHWLGVKRSTFLAKAGEETRVGCDPARASKSRMFPLLSMSESTPAFNAGSFAGLASPSVSEASTHIDGPVTP